MEKILYGYLSSDLFKYYPSGFKCNSFFDYVANPDANMQELALKTLDYFNEYGLWTVNSERDENDNIVYTIVQEKLGQTQYDQAKETLQQLNSNGFTSQEQSAKDETEIKQLMHIQSTWNIMR